MVLNIDIMIFIEIILVVLTLKLIVARWRPPIQESIQAIICIVLGTGIGYFLNPTKDGLIIGIISSSIAFYGKDLIVSFTTLKQDLSGSDIHFKKNL